MEYTPRNNCFQFEFDFQVTPKVPNFLDLAGSIPVPHSRRDLSWDEILEIAYSSE
jgi:hypothetical protein